MSDNLTSISNHLSNNDIEEALSLCNSWIKSSPNDPQALHTMGILNIKMNQLNEALTYFNHALRLSPQDPSIHTNIANTYKQLGAIDKAETHYKHALNLNPNGTACYNNLGALYYMQGKYEDSMLLFEKSLRISPNNWETHYNLANCLINLDFTERAVIHYEIAFELNPKHNNLKQNLAMAYVIEKQFSKAKPLLEEACERNPNHSELQLQLSEVYLETGDTEKAIKQHEKTLALRPNNHPLLHNLAVLYLRNKDIKNSKEYFEKAYQVDNTDLTAKHMLNALQENSDIEQAPSKYIEDLFNQYAQFYNKHVSDKLGYKVPEIMRSKIANFLGDKVESIRILDLGCGTGLCGIYFSDISFYMVGVDISREMLSHARAIQSYDGLCQINILQSIPGEGLQVFDLVLAADVLVYIGELDIIFQKVASALDKNGLFCFTVEKSKSNENHSHKLLHSGRFTHSEKYINSLAKAHNFVIKLSDEIELRRDNNDQIKGILYILEKE